MDESARANGPVDGRRLAALSEDQLQNFALTQLQAQKVATRVRARKAEAEVGYS